ncbi:MAG: hypothetical protein AAGD22_08440 [Verrucomicrobiota bacterium]
MDITNKTKKPMSVPLPGGKKLFLGPGKTGQVSSKALERPALAALIEAGDLEVSEGGASRTGSAGGGKVSAPGGGARQKGTGAMRQSGDR